MNGQFNGDSTSWLGGTSAGTAVGLLEVGLSNAITAGLLAVVVAVVCRWIRRPALRHALWVLVLLKLISPPLFLLPVGERATFAVWNHVEANAATSLSSVVLTRWLPTALIAVFWLWLTGAVFSCLRQFIEAWRFSKVLRAASIDGTADLQAQSQALAERLGLARTPPVVLIPGKVSPSLWALGPISRLLFPTLLLPRLNVGARATLIAHELAHYRRGDHWVRLLEMLVAALFWWNPCVGWIRRQIEDAEEECCDAWVVSQFPTQPRLYAEALIETVDFLSGSPARVPVLASGLGQVPALRRRLELIMRGTTDRSIPRPIQALLLMAAVGLVPLHLTLADKPPPSIANTSPTARPVDHVTVHPTSDDGSAKSDVAPGASQAGRDWMIVGAQRSQQRSQSTRPSSPPRNSLKTAPTASKLAQSRVPSSPPRELQLTVRSPDGRFAMIREADSSVRLQQIGTDRGVDLTAQQISSAAFSPDCRFLATGDRDSRVRLWDPATGKRLADVGIGGAAVQAVVFTPDGRYLISGSRDGGVRIWDVALRQLAGEVPLAKWSVNSLAVSPDGRLLAVASGNWMSTSRGRIAIWELNTLSLHLAFESEQTLGAVAFRDGGSVVVVGAWSGRLSFWNSLTGELIGSGQVSEQAIRDVGFAPDSPALHEAVMQPLPRSTLRFPVLESLIPAPQ